MAAADSTVWTWGRAKNYRLGRAFVGTDARIPEKVRGFEGVPIRQAACGGGHTTVVLEDDRLFSFGYSQYGQLGLGDRTDMCDPTQVFLVPPSIDAVAVGGGGLAAAPEAAAAVVTGEPLAVAQVCCGRYHTIARTKSGLVFTWGGGKNGRLGHGDEKIRAQPACVESLIRHKAVAVTSGYHNNLVLTEGGDVWSWGWGAHGQLGVGDTLDRELPTAIEGLSGVGVETLSCGDRHSFAVTRGGRVFGWGSNEFGQLGCGSRGDTLLSPVQLPSLAGLVVRAISAGDRHSAAVTNTGAVYTWGCGSDGQLGHGSLADAGRPKLVEALAGRTVVDVQCGHNFTMVLTKSHEAFAWGNNTYGQLGNNGNGKATRPVQVVVNSAARVRAVACAHFHCILWMEVPETARKGQGVVRQVKVMKAGAEGEAAEVQVAETKRVLIEASEKLAPLIKSYEERMEECGRILQKDKEVREKILADLLKVAS